jgi:3-carboxy-cis,cis-muconate cycloisomerase
MREAAAGLAIDPARMRANLDATRGAIFAERVMLLAAPVLGRQRAHDLLREALTRSQRESRTLAAIVADLPELAQTLSPDDLATLDDPRAWLGAAETLRRRLLAAGGADTGAER